MTLWYLLRAFGLVALLALTAATTLGAVSTVGRDPEARLLRQLVHRSVAVLGLVAVGLHIVLVVVDGYVDVPLTATVVPFISGYRPLAVGLGTLALYAVVIAALSGAVRGRLAGFPRASRRWRAVHLAAYAGWGLSVGHGLLAGTDAGTWWALAVDIVSLASVATALLVRGFGAPARRIRVPAGHLALDPRLHPEGHR